MSAHRGISGGEEDGEGGREIDVLIPQRYQDTAPCATNLPVQDRVQNGVVTLNVLKEHGDNISRLLMHIHVHTQTIIKKCWENT